MNNQQFFIMVIILALSVQVTRWLPFIVFSKVGELPPIVGYLGKVLPAAMMGLLVVYCFKDYDVSDVSAILPAAIGAIVVAGLHIWKRNTILSIGLGTAVYMLLVNFVF